MKPTKEEKKTQIPPDQRTMVKGTKALRQHDRQHVTWGVVVTSEAKLVEKGIYWSE